MGVSLYSIFLIYSNRFIVDQVFVGNIKIYVYGPRTSWLYNIIGASECVYAVYRIETVYCVYLYYIYIYIYIYIYE